MYHIKSRQYVSIFLYNLFITEISYIITEVKFTLYIYLYPVLTSKRQYCRMGIEMAIGSRSSRSKMRRDLMTCETLRYKRCSR